MFGLKEYEIKNLREFFSQYEYIENVYLFGSRARGDSRRDSDIDIAVEFKNIDDKYLRILKFDIEDISLLHEIDLIDINGKYSKKFIDEVNREKVLLKR